MKTKSKLTNSNKTIYDICVYSGMSSVYSYKLNWDTSVNKRTSWSAGWASSSRMSRLVLGSTQPPTYLNGKRTLYHVKSEVLTLVKMSLLLFWVVTLASDAEDESCPQSI
jgi:hypothetical protein